MKMRKRFAVGIVALASFWVLVGCGVTQQGHYYTDSQVTEYCAHVRPGSVDYLRYDCANRLSNTP